MGVRIDETGETLTVHGAGMRGLTEPTDILDCGNSGTTTRLLLGILAGQPFFTALTGDGSLRRRPMGRVTDPLRQMGARIDGREGGKLLPLGVRGGDLHGITYALPVASAQVKSSLLLAALFADSPTTLTGRIDSRDHTERMLRAMGADLVEADGALTLTPGKPTCGAGCRCARRHLLRRVLARRGGGAPGRRTDDRARRRQPVAHRHPRYAG